jgi:hypothetical protein
MAVTQKAPVGSTFADIISDPAWKKKPTWYQVSTNDRMIRPDTERRMAERMSPRTTIELDASHASLASQPNAPNGRHASWPDGRRSQRTAPASPNSPGARPTYRAHGAHHDGSQAAVAVSLSEPD